MKVLKLLLGKFKKDPYKTTIIENLKQINNKIANSKDYDEIVTLCREYNLLNQKLKVYENQKN